jgi:hypothetical protein
VRREAFEQYCLLFRQWRAYRDTYMTGSSDSAENEPEEGIPRDAWHEGGDDWTTETTNKNDDEW